MRGAILAWVGGSYLLQQQAQLPAHPILLFSLVMLLALALLLQGQHQLQAGPGRLRYLAWPVAGVAGFYWAACMASWALQTSLPTQLEGKNVTLVGTVSSLPYRFEGGSRFQFKVEQVLPDPTLPVLTAEALPQQIVLGWYDDQAVEPGERWQLTVRLQRPHGQANPHGFDYELWLLEQGIRATGYVREEGEQRRLQAFVFSPGNAMAWLRARLREKILQALPGQRYAPVMVALVLGDQRAVSQSDWAMFNRTGISHLVSISGLHITMIAGLFAGLVSALWRRSFFTQAQLPLILATQKVAALAAVVSALAYVALSGFGVPAQRTLIMLSVAALALWSGRSSSASHVLCSALALVVLIDPWAVLAPGFWLSFAAVGLIFFGASGRVSASASGANLLWRNLKAACHSQYLVTLGLLPFTLLLFGQFSVVGPVANALAIPLVSFVVTPLALLGSALPAPLCAFLLQLAHAVFSGLAQVLQWLNLSALAVWTTPQPAAWMFVLALAGMLWLLAPRGWPLRWLGPLLCLPVCLNQADAPAEGALWLTAFDIGQGNALLLETAHHRLVYDTGPAYSPLSDGGNRVIVPYLKARGIEKLDGLIVSHRDLDHVGGALSLLQSMPVGWLSSSLELEHPVIKAARQHQRCLAGQKWQWDGVQFEILHPGAELYADPRAKSNAHSCTLKVRIGQQSILLAGDIEAPQEAMLLQSRPGDLAATILLAPHHGSGTSSTQAFLQAVRPQWAVFQVGYHNRYRHPKQQVWQRYQDLGIGRLRTDEMGAIEMRLQAQGLHWQTYRQTHARYWYGR